MTLIPEEQTDNNIVTVSATMEIEINGRRVTYSSTVTGVAVNTKQLLAILNAAWVTVRAHSTEEEEASSGLGDNGS